MNVQLHPSDRLYKLMFLCLLCLFTLQGKANAIAVKDVSTQGSFPLVASGKAAQLVVDPNEEELISIVANAFSKDIELVTDARPEVVNLIQKDNFPVIIGTLGKSSLINQLESAGKIQTTEVKGKWETFCISVVNNPFEDVEQALIIYGSDPRGTAFGVFELSRMIGVSPLVWWADVTPKKRQELYITQGNSIFGPPSVQYRGLFINDEDWGMKPWAAQNMDTDIKDIGPRTYEKVFELILRLKSNYIWPAMHDCTKAFWYYKENPELARKYHIVLGSAHCEQMLRNNVDEWTNNFKLEYPGVTRGEWNWATNRNQITRYWADRVQESKDHDAIYTLGMRGIHDSGMPGYSNDNDKKNALKDIINVQRSMFQTYQGRPANEVPQIFCPYKEALTLYRLGIDLADDVTLLWSDDNYGYIRQLSNPQEQLRSGAGGVYYHFSYWGWPEDFLWLASTPPALTVFELMKAYQLNCKKIWLINVGDIKPQEYELQFAMDFAWNVNCINMEDANSYARQWSDETFGEGFADEIYDIKKEYYRLVSAGKPEHVSNTSYTTQEMERRLMSYDSLVNRVNELESKIPIELKDAYFQLITYQIEAAAAMDMKVLGARLSFEYGNQGRKDEALDMASRSIQAFQKIIALTNQYNHGISGGKWNGMMDYAPRALSKFYEEVVITSEQAKENTGIPAIADTMVIIPAGSYKSVNENGHKFLTMNGLGVEANALTVWPLNMTTYTASNIQSAPYAEYSVTVKKGSNTIDVRCLPTFPLYQELQLRFAASIDNGTPTFFNIKNEAESAAWASNILRGYANGVLTYESTTHKTITLRIYFPDAGLVVSSIHVTSTEEDPLTNLIKNPSFEYSSEGVLNDGTTVRGYPYGWETTRNLSGNSYGINNDMVNIAGRNACWINSTPMPQNFELYQTIKDLPAGEYVVRCRLAAFSDKLTNIRLFANNDVQYYGAKENYISNLTTGEINTFANYVPVSTSLLREMAVKVTVLKGEDLKLGIRSSNLNSNGTRATDQSGWFKVDHFRLESIKLYEDGYLKNRLDSLVKVAEELYGTTEGGSKIGQYPVETRTVFNQAIQSARTVLNNQSATEKSILQASSAIETAIESYRGSVITATSFIVNPSFEYKAKGVLNDGSTVRGTPYGWTDTGGLLLNAQGNKSWGINNDAQNIAGANCCWYLSTPMPEQFELYQVIEGLPSGEYELSCRMVTTAGFISTQRLFANDNVQYFGFSSDYSPLNLDENENATFAGWTATGANFLKDMSVHVTLKTNEPLKIGIRSSNKKADGSSATNDMSGWFKVDHFLLKLLKAGDDDVKVQEQKQSKSYLVGLEKEIYVNVGNNLKTGTVKIFTLQGNLILTQHITNQECYIAMPQGTYMVQLITDGKREKSEVIIVH